MQLAFWDFPPTKCLEEAAQSLSGEIERHSASDCIDLLRQQQVDIALLPVTAVLTAVGEFDILPGGAVSSWEYPFAQLRMHQGFQRANTLKSIPGQKLEEFMARVILKEHYGRQVRVIFDGKADAEIFIGPMPLSRIDDPKVLDIGQEWYELAQYPMVWGVYACLKGMGSDLMTESLMELTLEAESVTQRWGSRSDSLESSFFGESLRLRLDDITVAGLTAIRDYMYYYGIIEELVPLPIFESKDVQQLPWRGQDQGDPGMEEL